mmetsp:Transcript_17086/g.43824  ORF Transcript_17086/g.43824 Transcript_17086/m.43824 type:complete len:232 (+) Transcript_17086:447-1142(+)|eukprot:jgi/Tetstr1/438331/TSEL_026898.t1
MASFFGDYAGLGGEAAGVSSDSDSSGSEDSDSEEEQEGQGADEKDSAPQSTLPSFDDVFQSIEKPAFLDPEATRPVAENFSHQRTAVLRGGAGGAAAGGDTEAGADSAGGKKAVGVITGKAKLYTEQEQAAQQKQQEKGNDEGSMYSEAAIALMGGNVDKAEGSRQAGDKRKGPSAAMPVQDFLEKGVGGAALPRKRQDRKDKEKSKRQMGQSSIGEWKTEAEMVLRQQYD